MANLTIKTLATGSLLLALNAYSKGRYSDINIPLSPKKSVHYAADKKDNAIILYFKDAKNEQLDILNHYDSRLISRIIIKDHGRNNYVIRLFLRDRNINYRIFEMTEPSRLTISLFDQNYVLDRDPLTQLPLSGLGSPTFEPMNSDDEEPEFFKNPNDDSPKSNNDSSSSLRLVQTPVAQNESKIDDSAHGRGDEWKRYPPYIYPMTLSIYRESSKEIKSKPETETFQIAENAYKTFSFGDEKQALSLYQRVLYKEPTLFDRDPFHIWALGECQFGQGNLVLADGYYNSIQEKFPSSPLARFAILRRMDVKALGFIKSGKFSELPTLAKETSATESPVAEIQKQKLIRRAFWSRQNTTDQRSLPVSDRVLVQELSTRSANIENPKTAFLSNALVLKSLLQPESPWTEQSSKLVSDFFTSYAHIPEEDYLQDLRQDLITKVGTTLQKLSSGGYYVETISVYENLPAVVKNIIEAPENAWAVAEGYRNVQRFEAALPFYKTVMDKDPKGLSRFKAAFWLSALNQHLAVRAKNANRSSAADGYFADSRTYDGRCLDAWKTLPPDDRAQIKKTYQTHFEKTLEEEGSIKAAPLALLDIYKDESSNATKTTTNEKENKSLPGEAKQDEDSRQAGERVLMIHKLAERFGQENMILERSEALTLLRSYNPKKFGNNVLAQSTWAADLVSLAEDYRKNNEFMRAGQIYVSTADNAQNWEKRAESYYKGGLLLYKAGNREDAIKALTSASSDGNNLFYSNLAKERLTQFKK